ncbi:MAG: RNA polymerase factor sigma-32 [Desulfovibrionaceae bacterium]|nr:RNA polymerase factor sigma-32 [Desulfovibrionaceae bacterium]
MSNIHKKEAAAAANFEKPPRRGGKNKAEKTAEVSHEKELFGDEGGFEPELEYDADPDLEGGDIEAEIIENPDIEPEYLDGALFGEGLQDLGENPTFVFDSGGDGFDPSLPAPTDRNLKDGLTLYLREISKFPMLKPEEELMLARRVKEGDSDAAFRLVSSHLRLVVRIAMDFQRRWMQNVLDLIQEGNVGLMRAAYKFDSEKGIKFSYYAAFWIKAYILKFIMDNWRMVKIGTTQTQRKLFYNLNKERQRLIAQGFDPDSKTLAENLGVSESSVVEMTQRMEGSDVSLDMPLNDESNSSRMDFLPALGPGTEESLAGNELADILREELRKILPALSDKERDILQNRLLSDDPVTLREIGAKYNITRERVRQIETRLLQKLRAHMTREIEDFSEDWIRN